MIYLGGGGSAADESQLWDMAFLPGQRVAVWPFAQPVEKQADTVKWLRTSLLSRARFDIIQGDAPENSSLQNADVVAIPGGNAFVLMAHLRTQGLDKILRAFLARGGRVYGGSAGAVVLGADVAVVDSAKGGTDENFVELRDTAGLDLLAGYIVYPHFEADSQGNRMHCQNWANRHDVVVIGIPESCGVTVDFQGNARNCGPASVFLFQPHDQCREYLSGEEWFLREID